MFFVTSTRPIPQLQTEAIEPSPRTRNLCCWTIVVIALSLVAGVGLLCQMLFIRVNDPPVLGSELSMLAAILAIPLPMIAAWQRERFISLPPRVQVVLAIGSIVLSCWMFLALSTPN